MSTALITGASAGIGAEYARQLAARGDDLVLVARDAERLAALGRDLQAAHGIRTEVLTADLSDRADTGRVCDRLQDPDRPIDLLVNNAGFGLTRDFLDNDLAAEEAGLDVMVRAVLLTSHAAGRAMRARGRGRILNVSSIAGWIASSSYSAEKAFVTTLTEALATQLRGTGVTATAVCPGFTHTEFHGRAGLAMNWLPEALWLTPQEVVRESLADAEAGKVISIPGRQWKVLATAARAAPRPMIRSPRISSSHRRGR